MGLNLDDARELNEKQKIKLFRCKKHRFKSSIMDFCPNCVLREQRLKKRRMGVIK